MHILVTGGCGYVGSMLVPSLLDKGYRVSVVDIQWFGNTLPEHPNLTIQKEDIRNLDAISFEGIDRIIHLANIANDPCGELNAKLAWEVNVLSTMQWIEKAIEYDIAQFIFASSGSVYGVKDEDQVTEELSLVPLSDYNKTKMISERVLLSYADKITIQCLRPATVCGYSPRLRLDVSVNLLTNLALKNGQITVFGGDQTRPNIHIKDMVAVYHHFLELNDKAPGIFNAGFENISIMDIAKQVTSHVDAEIIVTPSNDPRSYRLNSDKLRATGFVPQFGVVDGITDIVEAFKQQRYVDTKQCHNIKTMKSLIEEGVIA